MCPSQYRLWHTCGRKQESFSAFACKRALYHVLENSLLPLVLSGSVYNNNGFTFLNWTLSFQWNVRFLLHWRELIFHHPLSRAHTHTHPQTIFSTFAGIFCICSLFTEQAAQNEALLDSIFCLCCSRTICILRKDHFLLCVLHFGWHGFPHRQGAFARI